MRVRLTLYQGEPSRRNPALQGGDHGLRTSAASALHIAPLPGLMRFRPVYPLAMLALLLVEILIARFLHDAVIRPHGGDALAVALVYCALRTVTPLDIRAALLSALAIAVGIEIGQYFELVDRLGLGSSRAARAVLGTGFDWWDLLAYGAGAAGVGVIECVSRVRTARENGPPSGLRAAAPARDP